jgi:hypothetical protein
MLSRKEKQMKSFMVPADHHAAVQRVLLLGRSGDAAALPELIALSKFPSNEVSRLRLSVNCRASGQMPARQWRRLCR